MTMSHLTKIMGVALVTALCACNNTEAPPPQLAPAPVPNDTQGQPVAEQLEHSELDAMAPFVLKLDSKLDNKTAPGEILIIANIDAPRPISAPTTINLKLPPGAILKSGNPEETLAYLAAGVTKREFRIQISDAPTAAAPISVAVAMMHPKGKFGAHAVQTFPAQPELSVKPSSVPRPPVSRPGAGLPVAKGKRSVPGTAAP
jgi:hypothetical protein